MRDAPLRMSAGEATKVAKEEKFSLAKILNKYCWKHVMNYSRKGCFRTLYLHKSREFKVSDKIVLLSTQSQNK